MLVNFVKYSGCGNDFILIDNRSNLIATPPPKDAVVRLCHRQNGIGADGLILLENSSTADFRMRIFNADGSEAEMCGNGIRCLAHFIHESGSIPSMTIETMQNVSSIEMCGDNVKVTMPLPSDFRYHHKLKNGSDELVLHYLNTGVPHSIIFVDDLTNKNLMTSAPSIRHHPDFHPKGTNVNFAKIQSENKIDVRTYERGVEQETLACGTGAVAVALAAADIHKLSSPITIKTRSQDTLQVSFTKRENMFIEVTMTGPAKKIYEGKVSRKAFD